MKLVPMLTIGLLLLNTGVSFHSCQSKNKKVVEDTYQDGKARVIKYYKGDGIHQVLVREVQYYPNGSKKIEGSYKDGKKSGKWIFYFENGAVWSIGSFENGLRIGKAKVYHENGEVFYTGAYLQGKKHGTWKFYNDEGKLVNTARFDNGHPISNQPGETHVRVNDSINR